MSKSEWFLYTKRGDFDGIAKKYNISPLLAKIIVNRGIAEDSIGNYLGALKCKLNNAHDFKNIDKAAIFIKEYIEGGKKIRVVGDYDIDGICSTYVLISALKHLGADADYEIPDRIKDGYGINESIIKKSHEDGCELIITCDNGIAAFGALELAAKLGVKVIVTDHHEVFREDNKDLLPRADMIVNPKQEDCSYPFKQVCGAFVAYRLIEVLYELFSIPKSEIEKFKEFIAIATVGDVMPLISENRIIVKQGLERIKLSENIGLKSLIKVCGIDSKNINSYDIGFILGPCFNASGRLESAKLSLKLLLTNDEKEAVELAEYIKSLNDERKALTQKGLEFAIELVESKYVDDDIIVAYIGDYHESLAGIIAGRLKERYKKPCFVITDTEEGLIKGSGRSIEAYNMFEGIRAADSLLTKYGGHPMAAGLSLEKDKLSEFRKLLNSNSELKESDFVEKIWIDIALPFAYLSEDFVKELSLLEPFGQGNQKPNFAQKQVEIINLRVFGQNRNVVKLRCKDSFGTGIDALIFTDGDEFIKELGDKRLFDIIYYPKINDFNNKITVQIVIRDWKFKY
ncbi:MAG: single-stranded-DNA-specific exonuclease RecJ [Lachnospiraceae bacterium]|nr:MAG: single-stranded-DNA-specific exonuclease RecJ [Lachnospiraceae bacterium]